MNSYHGDLCPLDLVVSKYVVMRLRNDEEFSMNCGSEQLCGYYTIGDNANWVMHNVHYCGGEHDPVENRIPLPCTRVYDRKWYFSISILGNVFNGIGNPYG